MILGGAWVGVRGLFRSPLSSSLSFFWEEDAKGEISEGQYQLDIAQLFENEPDRLMQLASIIILG